MCAKFMLIFFTFASVSHAKKRNMKCIDFKFSYIKKKKPIRKNISLCKYKNYGVSKDCKRGKCGLLNAKLSEIRYKSFGNPQAIRCFKAGGKPITGDLYRKGKVVYKSKTLCFTKNMRSYVDIHFMNQNPDEKKLFKF